MDRAHRHAGGADASIDRLYRQLRKGNPSCDYGVSAAAGVCGDVPDRDAGFLETEFAVAGTRSPCEPHAYVSRKSTKGAESNRAVAEAGRPGPAGGWDTHEVSNPLAAILGYSELLADFPTLSAEDQRCAEEIQVQARHAHAAVISLRNTLRTAPSELQIPLDEHPTVSDKDSAT
jgi:phospho-acceptor domain-containing protein